MVDGRLRRRPVAEYLRRQGRFAHFADEDTDYFQSQIDKMWEEWILPGVVRISQTPHRTLPTSSSLPQATGPAPGPAAAVGGGNRG
jgi:hypothetical protein